MIHKKGWQIIGNPNSELIFLDQWGFEFQPARPPFDPHHQQRLLEHLDHYHRYRLNQLATANSPP